MYPKRHIRERKWENARPVKVSDHENVIRLRRDDFRPTFSVNPGQYCYLALSPNGRHLEQLHGLKSRCLQRHDRRTLAPLRRLEREQEKPLWPQSRSQNFPRNTYQVHLRGKSD
jgi:hypothetical protein